ncbi:MAG: GerW family sporulation protein [Clostridia bacterium]|nr:GerW family sporulation protein [Clostridia bacterium]
MATHPINEMMASVMNGLQQMVDVNTVVGNPVETSDGTTIIPISKVGFGYAAGGSDFGGGEASAHFGGGSGAGATITPMGFLVVGNDQIRMVPVEASASAVDKLVDYIPTAISKVNEIISKRSKKENDED